MPRDQNDVAATIAQNSAKQSRVQVAQWEPMMIGRTLETWGNRLIQFTPDGNSWIMSQQQLPITNPETLTAWSSKHSKLHLWVLSIFRHGG